MAKKMVDGCGGPGLLKIPDNYSGNTNKATTDFTRQLMPPQAKSALSPAVGRLETQPVEVSYAFKLLVDEIQGLHLATKFDLKNKYDQ